jgi:hypothetical protein
VITAEEAVAEAVAEVDRAVAVAVAVAAEAAVAAAVAVEAGVEVSVSVPAPKLNAYVPTAVFAIRIKQGYHVITENVPGAVP